MSSLLEVGSHEREFEEILPLLDVDPGPSITELSQALLSQIPDSKFGPLIAYPDITDTPALTQINSEFFSKSDVEIWKTNVILLVGMAAHKIQQIPQHLIDNEGQQLILGQKPTAIVKDYFKYMAANHEIAQESRLPLQNVWERLRTKTWFQPEQSEEVCKRLKAIADREFMNDVFESKEDPELLNSKVAYLCSDIANWPNRYQLHHTFPSWLETFHNKARERVITTTIEQIDKGDNGAFEAMQTALRTQSLSY